MESSNQPETEAGANACSASRGSLESAINARRKEAIGEVLIEWGGYSVGDFVFVERTKGDGWTVSMPMTQPEIEEQKAKGSALRDWLTVMCVPYKMVRMVLPAT